jgi:hypothetical protein
VNYLGENLQFQDEEETPLTDNGIETKMGLPMQREMRSIVRIKTQKLRLFEFAQNEMKKDLRTLPDLT